LLRYDFAVYGLLAPEIGAAFFPSSSKQLQLINSFGVYLAAFLMRPIGAVLFGEIGDRLVGRKNALIFSILLITIPSILMGMLPTYKTWGVAAPILLVVLRMMQGLSVGGQLAGSYVLSIEQSSSRSRGFRGSVCDASSVRIPFGDSLHVSIRPFTHINIHAVTGRRLFIGIRNDNPHSFSLDTRPGR
jgi:MHS family proline/betaine transporter-like MFS transporter